MCENYYFSLSVWWKEKSKEEVTKRKEKRKDCITGIFKKRNY